jgi:hypothetical protein
MKRIAPHRLGRSLVVAAAAALAGCAAEAPLGSDRQPASPPNYSRTAELGECDTVRVPAGSKLAFHVYAEGVQIYRWNGASWTFVAPSALLSADAAGKSTVGTHYAGPTWQSNSGGKVVGTAIARCTPDATAIPWLLLAATPDGGPGVFKRTTYIQRLYTVGGLAPANAGSFTGETASVPYTAEYFFYRAP